MVLSIFMFDCEQIMSDNVLQLAIIINLDLVWNGNKRCIIILGQLYKTD